MDFHAGVTIAIDFGVCVICTKQKQRMYTYTARRAAAPLCWPTHTMSHPLAFSSVPYAGTSAIGYAIAFPTADNPNDNTPPAFYEPGMEGKAGLQKVGFAVCGAALLSKLIAFC